MVLYKNINLSDLSKEDIADITAKINESYEQEVSPEDRSYDTPSKDRKSDKFIIRNDFSKDRDRILFSKAFRRLEHKAQVYSHEKGDHFRTRLTHTLEVMQIARSIARNLGLNGDLTEAIALGHDIGHTPFGHTGEQILNEVMNGKDDLGGKISFKMDYDGFKHNYYSLKILDVIERKYDGQRGLNLTWQVLEGILKHTKIKKEDESWKLERFMQDSRNKTLLNELINIEEDERTFSVTLEGQIVEVADEIAQRQHDLDDGLRDKDLRLDYDKITSQICSFIDETISKISDKKKSDKFEIELLKKFKNNISSRKISKNKNYKWNSLIRDVIDYFIRDVTLNSIKNICNIDFKGFEIHNDKKIVKKRLISLSEAGTEIDSKIENYIKNQILNSYNVNRFDGKAIFIIRQLFKAYYQNPRQMPKYRLKMLSRLIKENSNNIYEIKFRINEKNKDITYLHDVNFESSDPKFIEHLINLMKLDKLDIEIKNLEDPSNLAHFFSNDDHKQVQEHLVFINSLNIKDLKDLSPDKLKLMAADNRDELLFVKCLLENHYAYLSVICDYIAGMTDNFANNEFKELYLVN